MQFTCGNNFLFYNNVDTNLIRQQTNTQSNTRGLRKFLVWIFYLHIFIKRYLINYPLIIDWQQVNRGCTCSTHFSRKASNLILNRFNFILIKFHHEFWLTLYMSRVPCLSHRFSTSTVNPFETKFRRWKDTSSSC